MFYVLPEPFVLTAYESLLFFLRVIFF